MTKPNLPRVHCLDPRRPAAERVYCKDCGQMVALVQSKKTNKWYTCQIISHTTDAGNRGERHVPWQPHFLQCRAKG